MPPALNHTIVYVRDKHESSRFVAEILGLPPPTALYHFEVVGTSNGVSLDFYSTSDPIQEQHYAFLVSEAEFDAIFARIQAKGIDYWADPARARRGQINHNDGGRGVYFEEPSRHLLEILTRPYGG